MLMRVYITVTFGSVRSIFRVVGFFDEHQTNVISHYAVSFYTISCSSRTYKIRYFYFTRIYERICSDVRRQTDGLAANTTLSEQWSGKHTQTRVTLHEKNVTSVYPPLQEYLPHNAWLLCKTRNCQYSTPVRWWLEANKTFLFCNNLKSIEDCWKGKKRGKMDVHVPEKWLATPKIPAKLQHRFNV